MTLPPLWIVPSRLFFSTSCFGIFPGHILCFFQSSTPIIAIYFALFFPPLPHLFRRTIRLRLPLWASPLLRLCLPLLFLLQSILSLILLCLFPFLFHRLHPPLLLTLILILTLLLLFFPLRFQSHILFPSPTPLTLLFQNP